MQVEYQVNNVHKFYSTKREAFNVVEALYSDNLPNVVKATNQQTGEQLFATVLQKHVAIISGVEYIILTETDKEEITNAES